MAVAHVATGSVEYENSGTTIDVTSPAGSIGDLLIFAVLWDDFSDGPPDDAPTGGVTLTEITDGTPQLCMNAGLAVWWGIEDQTAGRAYTFGTLSNNEQLVGACVRYSGHHPTAPYQSGSVARKCGYNLQGGLSANVYGGMFVGIPATDGNTYMMNGASAPPSWTQRFNLEGGGSYRMGWYDRPVDTYPMPQPLEDYDYNATYYQNYSSVAMFVIAPAETSRTISGVTKDKDGSALGSVVVSLFKDKGSGIYEYVDTATSHAATGAYSFTLYNDADAKFMVMGRKDDSPHVFDASDPVLTPA